VTGHRKSEKKKKTRQNGNAMGGQIAYSLFIVMFSGF
jgi:hypothetical protein